MSNLKQDRIKPRTGTLKIAVKFKFGKESGNYDQELEQLKQQLMISKNPNVARSVLHTAITEFFRQVNAGPPKLKSIHEDEPFLHVLEDPDDPR